MTSFFKDLPKDKTVEHFEDLLTADNVRIERIVSYGQTSPEEGWYDQEENEWVMVLSGFGTLQYEDGRHQHLEAGEYAFIPAGKKHKVVATAPAIATIWLAVFFKD
ncbi:cupin domain-containing protein [Thaumasiovibrio subtropicus]|uniref:cupin domain-containing protein n=1 Tax=Thaumasiovibrio subtropicus TaxID=1891207 RepID=UPI000B35FB7B|nr:cupin domain-containing protein [Thaumasiovibrio subtropicus]